MNRHAMSKRLRQKGTREPLIVRASVVAFCQALFTTVVLMNWWKLTPEQVAGWMGVIALGGTMVVVVWSRGKVTPVDDEW